MKSKRLVITFAISFLLLAPIINTLGTKQVYAATTGPIGDPTGENKIPDIIKGESPDGTTTKPAADSEVRDCLEKGLLSHLWSFVTLKFSEEAMCAVVVMSNKFAEVIGTVSSWSFGFARAFVNTAVYINTNDDSLKAAWGVVRDFTNSLFAIALIIIAFANMFRVNMKEYDIKIMLPRFFTTIVLVNLSWVICAFIVDFANVLVMQVSTLDNGVQAKLHDLTAAKGSLGEAVSWNGLMAGATSGGIFLTLIIIVLLFVIALIVGVCLMLMMAFRAAIMWILIAISPLAFAMSLMPFTKKLNSQWWSSFAKWAFMGAVVEFVLSLGDVAMHGFGGGAPWVKLVLAIAFYIAAFTLPATLGGKVMSQVSGKMTDTLQKGKNKAWTGRSDGKGNLGIRSRIPMLDSMRYKSDALHKQAASAQESVAKSQLAYGNTGQSRLDGLINNQKLVDKAIDEQQTSQKGSNADMMKGKSPEDLRSWIYDKNTGNIQSWTGTYFDRGLGTDVTREFTGVDLERHLTQGTFDQIRFANDGARKSAGRAGAAVLEVRNQGYAGNNAQVAFFSEINASHEAYKRGTGTWTADDHAMLIQNAEATSKMHQRVADRQTTDANMVATHKDTSTNPPRETRVGYDEERQF